MSEKVIEFPKPKGHGGTAIETAIWRSDDPRTLISNPWPTYIKKHTYLGYDRDKPLPPEDIQFAREQALANWEKYQEDR